MQCLRGILGLARGNPNGFEASINRIGCSVFILAAERRKQVHELRPPLPAEAQAKKEGERVKKKKKMEGREEKELV